MKPLFFISIFFILYLSCKSEKQDRINYDKVFSKNTINTDLNQHLIYKGEIIAKRIKNRIVLDYPEDKASINLIDQDTLYVSLFEKGVLYPSLFDSNNSDTTSLYKFSNICCFKELNKSETKRAYQFWVVYHNMLNPSSYTIQLENNKGTEEMPLESFLSNITSHTLKFQTIII